MRRLVVLPVAAGALASAGCGGTSHYSLAATSKCLRGIQGATLRKPTDFVAKSAVEGAVNVKLARNQVTLTFSETSEQADNIAKAYRRFRGKGIGIESALEEIKNVVLVWGVTPVPADRGMVHGCLKG